MNKNPNCGMNFQMKKPGSIYPDYWELITINHQPTTNTNPSLRRRKQSNQTTDI